MKWQKVIERLHKESLMAANRAMVDLRRYDQVITQEDKLNVRLDIARHATVADLCHKMALVLEAGMDKPKRKTK